MPLPEPQCLHPGRGTLISPPSQGGGEPWAPDRTAAVILPAAGHWFGPGGRGQGTGTGLTEIRVEIQALSTCPLPAPPSCFLQVLEVLEVPTSGSACPFFQNPAQVLTLWQGLPNYLSFPKRTLDSKEHILPWPCGSVGWSIVPVHRGCGFNPWSGHIHTRINQ